VSLSSNPSTTKKEEKIKKENETDSKENRRMLLITIDYAEMYIKN
jgi:hypothetical protein